jgi:1,4-dihydroxy-2-naphthoate octaprenyltransferase
MSLPRGLLLAAIVLLFVSLAITHGWLGWVILAVAAICICAAGVLYRSEEKREQR